MRPRGNPTKKAVSIYCTAGWPAKWSIVGQCVQWRWLVGVLGVRIVELMLYPCSAIKIAGKWYCSMSVLSTGTSACTMWLCTMILHLSRPRAGWLDKSATIEFTNTTAKTTTTTTTRPSILSQELHAVQHTTNKIAIPISTNVNEDYAMLWSTVSTSSRSMSASTAARLRSIFPSSTSAKADGMRARSAFPVIPASLSASTPPHPENKKRVWGMNRARNGNAALKKNRSFISGSCTSWWRSSPMLWLVDTIVTAVIAVSSNSN